MTNGFVLFLLIQAVSVLLCQILPCVLGHNGLVD